MSAGTGGAPADVDAAERLAARMSTLGGPAELLGLLDDYRQLVGLLVRAADPATPVRPAHGVVQDVRTWWSRRQLLRMALDLPEREGRLFLGR